MLNAFHLFRSDKVGLTSPESYVVVRNQVSFLRVLGDEPEWSLLTATASEDHGRIEVCFDQRRLIEAALRFGAELKTEPKVERDWAGREYVRVCFITRDDGQSTDDFNNANFSVFTRFFEIFDGLRNREVRGADEMRELYDALAIDDGGEEVYLSDGVWLSSNGSLNDRGK